MARLFGTDGVRGVANTPPMTAEMALEIGRATAHVCKKDERRHRVLIGKDTRISCYMIENALTAGICSMGVDVLLVGPMPTPGIAFLTQDMRADAGVVISASHNPYQDNGIKIFSRDGYKLPDRAQDEIEDLIVSGKIKDIRPTADDIGKAYRIDDAAGRYIVFCKGTFPDGMTLDGMRIVLDCANGATYKIAPTIFTELGAEVTTLHNTPNGMNINDNCGAQHTEDLRKAVKAEHADVGLAFDGDGDRLIVVDEQGHELTGDHILAICARHLKASHRLKNNRVVSTVMSNFGLRTLLHDLEIENLEAQVGDRYVLETMQEHDAILGGEQSGHIIFLDHHTTGDGIISALQLLAVVRSEREPLSKQASLLQSAPQRLINVRVSRKPPIEELPRLQAAIREAESELGDRGRVLVRHSGTQSICRVMVEAHDAELTERLAESLAMVVTECMG